ncbi:hypothetical protein RRG08_058129 [Elysia crispata]|uniref:Uncharacterized protein n=1 Tax=Elysia crispata TaxID=231223 RepID=A0AAE1AEB3_9GAST|nr:hypothetical protein RRG08_058129 [Elysia crispata]
MTSSTLDAFADMTSSSIKVQMVLVFRLERVGDGLTTDHIKTLWRTKFSILYSGRDNNHHSEGVVLVLDQYALKSLRGWEQNADRIIMASFNTRRKNGNMNIVHVYTPVIEAEEETKGAVYNRLYEAIDQLPKKKNVMLLRQETPMPILELFMGKWLGLMKDNGKRLENFCDFNGFIIGGSVFPHKRIHKATENKN